MSKAKTAFLSLGIICLLLCVSHLIHFLSPLLRLSDSVGGSGLSGIPEDGDDIDTPEEFFLLALSFENYDWDNYDKDDFPEWLYMPETEEVNNESDAIIFGAYAWENYDPEDFPAFLVMPEELPDDFDETDGDWVFEYIDEDFIVELSAYAESFEEGEEEGSEEDMIMQLLFGGSGSTGVSEPIINVYELVYALICFIVAIAFYWISRSVGGA